MSDLIIEDDDLQEPILVAPVQEAYRAVFRVMDPRHVAIVDVDTDGAVSEGAGLAALDALVAVRKSKWATYRTHGGLRYIELSRLWWPRTTEMKDVMTALLADPQYVDGYVLSFKEGRESGTFSARLDPKPWNLPGGPDKATLKAMSDAAYGAYKVTYAGIAPDYRACEFLGLVGDEESENHPWAQMVLDFHDAQTRATEELPLA